MKKLFALITLLLSTTIGIPFIQWVPVQAWADTLASPAPDPILDYGSTYAGGKLYTYNTGTTTPKTTWTDSTKATPNTNPVVLDSNGRANVWIDSSDGAYRFRLTTSSGLVTLYTKDNIESVSSEGITSAIAAIPIFGVALSDYSGVLADAITGIGADVTRLIVDVPCIISTNTEIPANITVQIVPGEIITVNNGITLTMNGNLEDSIMRIQIFNCIGTGKVVGLTNVDPRWFGAVVDKVTSDIVAWQQGFAAFGVEGGIFHVPDDTYLGNAAGIQIIWPNNGTKCYHITIKGDAAMPTSGTYGSSGGSEVKYDGAGTLFDCTNGNDTLLDWRGCRIEGVRWSNANPYTAGSVFLKIGDFTEGAIVNNFILGFETGVWWLRYGYYSLFQNNYVGYCYRGVYVQDSTDAGATANGLTFAWNRIAYNTIGIEIVRGGSPVSFDNNWIENSTTYGLLATNCRSIVLNACYFETNGTETSIKIVSDPLNSTQFSMFGGRIYHNLERYAITFDYVPNVCIIGTEIDTGIDGGYAIRWLNNSSPRGMIAANFGPRVNNTRLMNRHLSDGIISGSPEIPIVSTGYSEGAYVENRIAGDWLLNSFQYAGHGNKLGTVVTDPGAGSSVTALSGITATTSAASAVVTFNTTPFNLHPGSTITIAGETFTDGGVSRSYARIAEFTSNTIASIHGVADVGVAGAAVAWNSATKLNAYGIQLADESTNVPTVGVTETTLTTYTMTAGTMGATGKLSLHNNGSKTDALGNLTLTYYVGATSHAMPVIAAADDWILDVHLRNETAASQNYDWVLYISNATTHVTTTYSGQEEASVDTANETIFKLTGTCSDAADIGTSKHSTWYVPPY